MHGMMANRYQFQGLTILVFLHAADTLRYIVLIGVCVVNYIIKSVQHLLHLVVLETVELLA